ncbi:MAG: nucleotide exchange factor GrpE [Eikenella corrodens]
MPNICTLRLLSKPATEYPLLGSTIVNVMQKGYTLHDRVLRPATVSVAKAPEAK